MESEVKKVKCMHCNGTGRVEDHIWVLVFMPNGTKECFNCAGRGYVIIKNGFTYTDYDGKYENEKIENEYKFQNSGNS